LGSWLNRKWINCQKRKTQAQADLDELGIDMEVLRAEWAAQIKEQTKPLVRRSANLGNKIIEEVLALRSTLNLYKHELQKVEKMLETEQHNGAIDIVEATTSYAELQMKCNCLQLVIDQKQKNLDVDGRFNLRKLLDNKYIQTRMNALALKK
jgi:hypothetical protein